ncbi:unnamed protein product [Schistosoma margrebowiei]|uniref:Uncharacterized protein n=1 Tax=Schistosoma margrebowiei TaxID=48269 RepID=A0A183N814_9TREM|nr:unnamed protein product [Schistosoma margrebowiei]
MKTSTSEGKRAIQWTAWMQLDDLEFADGLALLSHTQQEMEVKTNNVAAASASVGLNIHKGKSKTLEYHIESTNPIKLDGEAVETFTYLDSIIDEHGRSDANVKAQICKARVAFLQLKNIRNSKQLSANIKVRIFNTNVKTVLLYGDKTWRATTDISIKVYIFINNCLRKIIEIRWPTTINNDLLG